MRSYPEEDRSNRRSTLFASSATTLFTQARLISVTIRATAEMLFGFLNVIAEKTISVPKRIEEVYGALPEDARDAIAKRDANT